MHLDEKLVFFTDEAWFHLRGYISAQDNDKSMTNPRQHFEASIHYQKIGVWCATTATWILEPIFSLKLCCLRA
jgi:hypothetical protein